MKISSYHATVEVKLKKGHVDSEGLTTERALKEMGYEVDEVSTAKVYEIDFEASSKEEADEKIEEMCRKLLANPVKDDYEIKVNKAE